MSFFIRKRRGFDLKTKPKPLNTGGNGKKHARKVDETNEPGERDESIASSDEELAEERAEKQQKLDQHVDDEDDEETPQEKRVKLAKAYLERIEDEENDRAEFEEGAVEERLRRDYLEEKGDLCRDIAGDYTGEYDVLTLRYKDRTTTVTCLCLSSDGRFVYAGSKNGKLVKWSLQRKAKVRVLRGRGKSKVGIVKVNCVAVSTDDKFLAVGDGGTNSVKIYNAEDFLSIKELHGHQKPVSGLVFRKNTHTLYSASGDRSVKVWDLDDMAYVETLYGHQSAITSIDAMSRLRVITSGGYDDTLRIWKIVEESQLIFDAHCGIVDCVKAINSRTFLSSGGDDGKLCTWSTFKKKPLCVVKAAHGYDEENGQPVWITSIAAVPNSDLVASGARDGFIRFWKCEDFFKRLTPLLLIKIAGFVNAMAFAPNATRLVAGVGQEHRLGRWCNVRHATNGIYVIQLKRKNDCDEDADTNTASAAQ